MAERIGDSVPAPLRFELGQAPVSGDSARAVLLVTVNDDGAPRVAVIAPSEIVARDPRTVRIEIRSGSGAAANLARGSAALVWCVLDAAAYSICGTCVSAADPPNDAAYAAFDLRVQDVYRDFEARAPMISPPMYRAP